MTGGARLAAIVTVLVVLQGCDFFESPMTLACDEAIQKRLRAPSTYQRIDVRAPAPEELPPGQWYAQEVSRISSDTSDAERRRRTREAQAEFERLQQSQVRTVRFKRLIEYDAANAFGAPLRAVSECEYISETGTEDDATASAVRVDGRTHIEFLDEQLGRTGG